MVTRVLAGTTPSYTLASHLVTDTATLMPLPNKQGGGVVSISGQVT